MRIDSIQTTNIQIEKFDYTPKKLSKCFQKYGSQKETFIFRNTSLNISNIFVSETSKDKRTLFEIMGNSEKIIINFLKP